MDFNGRCIGCGFLAKHAFDVRRVPTPSYYEIETDERENGEAAWSHLANPSQGPIKTEPVCFRQVIQMREEIEALEKEIKAVGVDSRSDATHQVFYKDRKCQSWYQYTPGFTPMDHLMNLKTELLEQAHQDSERRLRESERHNRRMTYVILFLMLIQIVTAIAVLAYPHGFPLFTKWTGQQDQEEITGRGGH